MDREKSVGAWHARMAAFVLSGITLIFVLVAAVKVFIEVPHLKMQINDLNALALNQKQQIDLLHREVESIHNLTGIKSLKSFNYDLLAEISAKHNNDIQRLDATLNVIKRNPTHAKMYLVKNLGFTEEEAEDVL